MEGATVSPRMEHPLNPPATSQPVDGPASPPPATPPGGYVVKVDDNFHHGDSDERYTLGVYPTLDEAVAACARVVIRSLHEAYKPGMTADQLYEAYVDFGEDPWIAVPCGPDQRPIFSAWDFARQMAPEIIANPPR